MTKDRKDFATDMKKNALYKEHFLFKMLFGMYEPPKGDLLVDEKYLLEIGGKTKTFRQVADMPDSYVVADDEETGFGNRIPLWLFGFLY